MKIKCLIVLLQISWAFAQGGFEGFEGMNDFGGFSLIQQDMAADGAGASNDTSNDTSTEHQMNMQPGGAEQPLLYQPGGGVMGDQPGGAGMSGQPGGAAMGDQPGGVMADQPPVDAVPPTRLPGVPTAPPPLVRQEGNATGNATTSPLPATDSPKSKGEGGGSAEVIANFALVVGVAGVLRLLY